MLNISILFHIQVHISLYAILPSPQKARTKKIPRKPQCE